METRHPFPRIAYTAGRATPGGRLLAEEVAVALSYNGSTQAVMMATPADLEDFAFGFTLTEGIADVADIRSVEPVVTPLGIDLQIWLRDHAAEQLAARRRSMAGPVGCGLCGIDSLGEAVRRPRAVASSPFRLTAAQVVEAAAALTSRQPLHDATRAVHGAAFWTPGDGIVAAREDVGRHNALDKLAGALVRRGSGTEGALVLSSRVSIDLVQKACAIGAPVLIAVSAPTAAAVAMAEEAGITLVALARDERFEVYTRAGRIEEEGADVA